MLGPSGWHKDPATNQWYWASFLPFQPDLNYRNPAVKAAMFDVVRTWLSRGADGLRLDVFHAVFKNATFADEPLSMRPLPSADEVDGFFRRRIHTVHHRDTFVFARELRKVVDQEPGPSRLLIGEVFGRPRLLRDYVGDQVDGLHLVFLFKTMRTPFSAVAYRALIKEFEAAFPEPLCPTWVFGNHDSPRVSARLGGNPAKLRLIATLQLTLRGVPFIYYGDELGIGQHPLKKDQVRDPVAHLRRLVPTCFAPLLWRCGVILNRDEARRPMHWDGSANAGFAPVGATPWLPIDTRSSNINVAGQEDDPCSLLSLYRRLLALRRRSIALHAGRLEMLPADSLPFNVIGYRRIYKNESQQDVAHVLLNFSHTHQVIDLRGYPCGAIHTNYRERPVRPTRSYKLYPYEGIVLV
jgi:oligo-1,6-glucosidase/alpha-glucosidase